MKNWYLKPGNEPCHYYIQHHNTYEDDNVRLEFEFNNKDPAEKFLAVLNEVEDDMSFSINGETMQEDQEEKNEPFDFSNTFFIKRGQHSVSKEISWKWIITEIHKGKPENYWGNKEWYLWSSENTCDPAVGMVCAMNPVTNCMYKVNDNE